jgi:glucose-1-phosphate cytidylyltransferase
MRPEIFDYISEGEDLVGECFDRLIANDKLLIIRHEGFWCPMDTLKDKQRLEEMVEKAYMPWRLPGGAPAPVPPTWGPPLETRDVPDPEQLV